MNCKWLVIRAFWHLQLYFLLDFDCAGEPLWSTTCVMFLLWWDMSSAAAGVIIGDFCTKKQLQHSKLENLECCACPIKAGMVLANIYV